MSPSVIPSLPILIAAAALAVTGCGSSGDRDPGGAAAAKREVRFVDVAHEAGLSLFTACGNIDVNKDHLLETTGTGVAVADFDGDGLEDIYMVTAQTTDDWMASRRPRANALYRNNGDGTFADVAESAGVALREWGSGAFFADFDNDSDKDLFVTAWGPNRLFRNNGDGTFTDVTEEAGVAGPADAWSTSAAFGDLDGDGDLDLYVTNYCEYDLWNPPFGGAKSLWKGIAVYPGPTGFIGQPDVLYRNDGDGRFTDVSQASGVASVKPLYGLGVVMSDLDDDGDLDIYVANDATSNFLWRNDGGFGFTEMAAYANAATNEDGKEMGSMGVDAGDFDGDGRIDLMVTNFSHEWNTLYRNEGGLMFADATFEAGFQDSFLLLVWGLKFFDYDHDGWQDVFTANGHIYAAVDDHPHLNTTYKQANSLYRNRGGRSFENTSASAGAGMQIVEGTRGAAWFDVDRDGDLDIVLTNIDSTPSLLRNEGGNARSWISVLLEGVESNRDAVGARVTLLAGGRRQVREVNPFGSYQSQSSYRVHFGLADEEKVDRLTIRWPSGRVEELVGLSARRFLKVTEGGGVTSERPAPGVGP